MTEPVPGEIAIPEDSEDVEPDDGQAHFEGPRRRARREREERRAVQVRARAIEDARRDAKRRASGSADASAKPAGRSAIRGLKVLMWSVLITVVAVALGLVLYFTPVMSVRSLVVDGLTAIPREDVVAAVAVRPNTPLLQVDTDQVADRVAAIRRVASVRVQREYPSSLRVTVVERVPVAFKNLADGPHLFDRDGVDFATAPPPPGVPFLDVGAPGPTDPPTMAALQVLTALPPEVAGQVIRITAPSVASITLTLTDGREVIWGTTDRTDEKAAALAGVLSQPGRIYDVSSPGLATVVK